MLQSFIYIKRISIFFLIIIMVFLSTTAKNHIMSQQLHIIDIQEKLKEISGNEDVTLNQLFNLTVEIENIKKEIESLSSEIEIKVNELDSLEKSIEEKENELELSKKRLKAVLRSYQKSGSTNYLEIILQSNSFNDLLKRISILQEVVRNTNNLLHNIQSEKYILSQDKEIYNKELEDLANKERELQNKLDYTHRIQEDFEKLLLSLSKDKSEYKNQLELIQYEWNNIKPTLIKIVNELSDIVDKGDIPPNALSVSISLRGIVGTIEQDTFNSIINQSPKLSNLHFEFNPSETIISIPDNNLVLIGNLEASKNNTVIFHPIKGYFYSISLDQSSIFTLLDGSELKLDFNSLMAGYNLRSIKVNNNQLELFILPSLFN